MIIDSRLGRKEVDQEKIIHFPRGLIGYQNLQDYVLLQINENSPMLVLQSVTEPTVGLLVADPFSFLPNYSAVIADQEQAILGAKDKKELVVLVTVSIPQGEPEKTALNLLGPIFINYEARKGLQVPQQPKKDKPAKLYLHEPATIEEAEQKIKNTLGSKG